MSVEYRHMDQPHDIYWREAKWILHFVQGTKTHGIHYVAKYDLELVGFTNYDWAGDKNDRKSTSRYVFMLVDGPISCSSKNKFSISLCSTKEEYKGVVNASTKYSLWLQGTLGEFGIESDTYRLIYCDN